MLGSWRWTHLLLFLYAYLLGWGAGAALGTVARFIAELGAPWVVLRLLSYSLTALRFYVLGFCGCWFAGGDWRLIALVCGGLALTGELFVRQSPGHLAVGALACAAGAWTLARQGRSERLDDLRRLILSPLSQR